MNYIRNFTRDSKCIIIFRSEEADSIKCECKLNNHGRLDWVEIDGEKVTPSKFRSLGIKYAFFETTVLLEV